MRTADVDQALDTLIGDAESYWELSDQARVQYDRLQARRLSLLGLPASPAARLAPSAERPTLDGNPISQELAP